MLWIKKVRKTWLFLCQGAISGDPLVAFSTPSSRARCIFYSAWAVHLQPSRNSSQGMTGGRCRAGSSVIGLNKGKWQWQGEEEGGSQGSFLSSPPFSSPLLPSLPTLYFSLPLPSSPFFSSPSLCTSVLPASCPLPPLSTFLLYCIC